MLVVLAAGGGGAFFMMKKRAAAKAAAELAAQTPPPAPVAVAEPAPPPPPPPDTTLTNDSVLAMVKEKVPTDLILSQIRSADKTNFDLSTPEVIRLTKGGVSPLIIEQLRNPKRSPLPPPAPTKGNAPQNAKQNAKQNSQPAQTAVAAPVPAPRSEPRSRPRCCPGRHIDADACPSTGGRRASDRKCDGAGRYAIPHYAGRGYSSGRRNGAARALHNHRGFQGEWRDRHRQGSRRARRDFGNGQKEGVFGIGGSKLNFKLNRAEGVGGHSLNVRALAARKTDGTTQRPADNGQKTGSKDIAASQGSQYIGYIDGEQSITVPK